jgi:hypothetical protein
MVPIVERASARLSSHHSTNQEPTSSLLIDRRSRHPSTSGAAGLIVPQFLPNSIFLIFVAKTWIFAYITARPWQ